MDRSNAILIAHSTLTFCEGKLATVARSVQPLSGFLKSMIDVRARLHEAARMFERGNASEDHEDLYLPIFDALSLVASSIQFGKVRKRLIVAALEAIRQIPRIRR